MFHRIDDDEKGLFTFYKEMEEMEKVGKQKRDQYLKYSNNSTIEEYPIKNKQPIKINQNQPEVQRPTCKSSSESFLQNIIKTKRRTHWQQTEQIAEGIQTRQQPTTNNICPQAHEHDPSPSPFQNPPPDPNLMQNTATYIQQNQNQNAQIPFKPKGNHIDLSYAYLPLGLPYAKQRNKTEDSQMKETMPLKNPYSHYFAASDIGCKNILFHHNQAPTSQQKKKKKKIRAKQVIRLREMQSQRESICQNPNKHKYNIDLGLQKGIGNAPGLLPAINSTHQAQAHALGQPKSHFRHLHKSTRLNLSSTHKTKASEKQPSSYLQMMTQSLKNSQRSPNVINLSSACYDQHIRVWRRKKIQLLNQMQRYNTNE